jgi:hypothetical protein
MEGGECDHHRLALVVEEDYPAALKDAHNATAVFGTEKADANNYWSSTPHGALPPWSPVHALLRRT